MTPVSIAADSRDSTMNIDIDIYYLQLECHIVQVLDRALWRPL